jgi:hypothetical protein
MTSAPFVERTSPPSASELESVLGPAAPRWRELERWFAETYGLAPEPVWFGRDGWALRYRRSGRTLTTLIPRDRAFQALVVIGPAVAPQVADLELGEATQAAFAAARPYPDGRWLFLSVADDATVLDVERLVAAKSPPPRRPRAGVRRAVTPEPGADPVGT